MTNRRETNRVLSRLQQDDAGLKKYQHLKKALKNCGYEVKYEKRGGLLHQIRNLIDDRGNCWKQIIVPKMC